MMHQIKYVFLCLSCGQHFETSNHNDVIVCPCGVCFCQWVGTDVNDLSLWTLRQGGRTGLRSINPNLSLNRDNPSDLIRGIP